MTTSRLEFLIVDGPDDRLAVEILIDAQLMLAIGEKDELGVNKLWIFPPKDGVSWNLTLHELRSLIAEAMLKLEPCRPTPRGPVDDPSA